MTDRGAAALLRSIGLMVDGPVTWGRPTGASGPGIYVVELPESLPHPPVDLTVAGKWIEHLPELRLDGERPTSRALANRIASFWWSDATILYAGATEASLGPRIGSLTRHVLGDRRPHADGHWLGLLRGAERLRIWWAPTPAPVEYLDAFLDAFAASGPTPAPDRPAGAPIVPWAVTRRPTGERVQHGITGSLVPEVIVPPPPPVRRVEMPDGVADGVDTEARGTGTTRRVGDPKAVARRPTPARPARTPAPRAAAAPRARALKPGPRAPEPVHLTMEAIARMREELTTLTRDVRPEVVLRIKTAREHGDLKENAEYHAAREEQSFLEGRIRTIEERLRNAVVIEESEGGAVRMGTTVTVEADDETRVFSIVGTTESDPAAGRLSAASPVGAALLGARVGDEVEVRTPRGPVRYRVVAVA